jgi:hypothetical protein
MGHSTRAGRSQNKAGCTSAGPTTLVRRRFDNCNIEAVGIRIRRISISYSLAMNLFWAMLCVRKKPLSVLLSWSGSCAGWIAIGLDSVLFLNTRDLCHRQSSHRAIFFTAPPFHMTNTAVAPLGYIFFQYASENDSGKAAVH